MILIPLQTVQNKINISSYNSKKLKKFPFFEGQSLKEPTS